MKTFFRFLAAGLMFALILGGCKPLSTLTSNPAPAISSTTESIPVKITFVGNSGFLIEAGDKKILIDSLYEGFAHGYQIPPSEMESLMNAAPPFDHIDLVLATHRHGDHFSASTVRQYLEKYPEVKFASTAQVTSLLTEFGDQVITMDAKVDEPVEANIKGIEVDAIYLSHGIPSNGSIETINNAYLVTVNGITFFHTGDIDPALFETENLKGYQLSDKNIDVGLILHAVLSDPLYEGVVKELIKSKYIIPIHYEYNNDTVNWTKIKEYFPQAVYFAKEKQTWKMPE